VRNIINIVREAETGINYYHGSRNKLPLNTILSPQQYGYVRANDPFLDDTEQDAINMVEQYLEKYRPQNAISRMNAVFLASTISDIDYMGGYTDYVYVVEPLTNIHKCNIKWYGEIYMICESNILGDETIYENKHQIIQYAKNYWNAELSEGSRYEYLCGSAKIIENITI